MKVQKRKDKNKIERIGNKEQEKIGKGRKETRMTLKR